jgi:membrane protein DedA with SNARE-associated domain
MSLIAVLLGFVVGLTQPLRRAVAATVGTWVLAVVYLAVVAAPSADESSADHALTWRFWLLQVAVLLVALAATWTASRLRLRRRAKS